MTLRRQPPWKSIPWGTERAARRSAGDAGSRGYGRAQGRTVPIIVRRIGSAQAVNKVKSRIAGNIVRVSVTEGQYVHQGDPLIDVDPRRHQARLEQEVSNKTKDQANLENAQRDLPRYSAIVSNQLAVTRQNGTS